jgi:hypothetical protein
MSRRNHDGNKDFPPVDWSFVLMLTTGGGILEATMGPMQRSFLGALARFID